MYPWQPSFPTSAVLYHKTHRSKHNPSSTHVNTLTTSSVTSPVVPGGGADLGVLGRVAAAHIDEVHTHVPHTHHGHAPLTRGTRSGALHGEWGILGLIQGDYRTFYGLLRLLVAAASAGQTSTSLPTLGEWGK